MKALVALAILGGFTLVAMGGPTFVDRNLEARVLNAGDATIGVQKIQLQGDSEASSTINALQVRNTGTATHEQIVKLDIYDGVRTIVSVDGPVGLATPNGVTLEVDHVLPQQAVTDWTVRVWIGDDKTVKGDETVALETRFHYITDRVAGTSPWIADGAPEDIRMGGFEIVEDASPDPGNFNPGNIAPVQEVVFEDRDANTSDVYITGFRLSNTATATDADISEVKVTVSGAANWTGSLTTGLTAWRDGGVTLSPTSPVRVPDNGTVTVTVEVRTVAGTASFPREGATIRSRLILKVRENAIDHEHESIAPTTFTIRRGGVEEVEETSTIPLSQVLNPVEVLIQRFLARDDDVNTYDATVRRLWVRNRGTATGADIAQITVRSGNSVLGTFSGTAIAGLTTGVWLNITNTAVPDQGDRTFAVEYKVASDVTPGRTLQPQVRLESLDIAPEDVPPAPPPDNGPPPPDDDDNGPPPPPPTAPATNEGGPQPTQGAYAFISGSVTYPEAVDLRLAGLEYMKNLPLDDASALSHQRVVAQKLHLEDRDENTHPVTINPIIVRNVGTASDAAVKRIEIRDAQGRLLGETEDIGGLTEVGATIPTLEHNMVEDNTTRIVWVFVTLAGPEGMRTGQTLQLDTTVVHNEGGTTYRRSVRGEKLTLERSNIAISWSPATPSPGTNVSFSAQYIATNGRPPTPYSYSWEFGDGRTSSASEPRHSYTEAGSYAVTLRLRDGDGTTHHGATVVTVPAPPEEPNGEPPTIAELTASPTLPEVGARVTFTATAQTPPGDPVTNWEWQFGDGATSTSAPPVTHAYTAVGTYMARVRAHNAQGGAGPWRSVEVRVRPESDEDIGVMLARNPVRQEAEFLLFLPEGARDVELRVFDLTGRLLYSTNVEGDEAIWDLTDPAGRTVLPGLYFYLITATENAQPIRSETGRILVVR